MIASAHAWPGRLLIASLVFLIAIAPSSAQSNRSLVLASDGAWHLRSHIPLGADALVLEPSHRLVQVMATAEAPGFAGWTLRTQGQHPVLLDGSGQRVQSLPRSITFRVTVSARNNFSSSDSMPFTSTKSLDEFLLDMHFSVQIFRGIEMRPVNATRQWMIGIPADESADERIYRASFDLGDARPDDRIVLLVTDGSGARITKFHLEFL